MSVFAPADPAFVADPYPAYATLRDGARAQYHEQTNQWLIPRHADVNALLRDRRLGRSYLHVVTHEEMGRPAEPGWLEPFWHVIRNGMLDREPPDHTRLRRLVSRAFTPRVVEQLRPRVQAIMDTLVDRVAGAGSFDLVRELAEPLPVAVIAELLGIPAEDRHALRPWSADICGMYELNPTDEAGRTAVRAAVEFSEYLRALSRERRQSPGNDLISGLAAVVDAGDQLTEDELIGTCVLLLNAGHEASVNGTANAWWSLFRHPDQRARLRGDHPSLLATAVDELLRYDTPLQMFERWALEPISVGEIDIPRGSELALLFGSANRDPAAFERPNTLDLAREPNPHVSFGAGIHYCLGAPLARMEMEISFDTILRRLPSLRLEAEPAWKPSYIIRGLRELRVSA
ncbi:MAG: cytochrome P450 [Candidatus Limnocylindria bacterium]